MTEARSKVGLRLCGDYERGNVEKAVRSCIEDLGGIRAFTGDAGKVLIKPNMLAAKTADRMVTTHPEVLRAVMGMVADEGLAMVVGDSPAIGSSMSVARKSGMLEVVEHFGAGIVSFSEACRADTLETCAFKHIELAREALEAEAIINVCKVKTHGAMTLTVGVKNLFGCVVGRAKTQWHLKAGRDALAFARMLVDIYATLRPALTVADGIVGMEGNGPGSGDLRKFGWIAAASDAVAMDRVVAEILRVPESKFYIMEAARAAGVGQTDLAKIDIVGDTVADARAAAGTVTEGIVLPDEPLERAFLGRLLRRVFKRSFTPEPSIDHEACTRCGTCINACPPEVMRLTDMPRPDRAGRKQRVEIDRQGCIHCFCCQELCPEGAITIKKGRLAGLLTK